MYLHPDSWDVVASTFVAGTCIPSCGRRQGGSGSQRCSRSVSQDARIESPCMQPWCSQLGCHQHPCIRSPSINFACFPPQHSSAQHSTSQHSTAQQSTAQHTTPLHTTPHLPTPHHTTPTSTTTTRPTGDKLSHLCCWHGALRVNGYNTCFVARHVSDSGFPYGRDASAFYIRTTMQRHWLRRLMACCGLMWNSARYTNR